MANTNRKFNAKFLTDINNVSVVDGVVFEIYNGIDYPVRFVNNSGNLAKDVARWNAKVGNAKLSYTPPAGFRRNLNRVDRRNAKQAIRVGIMTNTEDSLLVNHRAVCPYWD